ncbi:MAG: flagellin lysine-N-methylase [Bacillota bacterium]
MTDKKKHVRMPLYLKEFQCIGGSCEDNCCISWDVEIDKKTYQKYQQVKDKELSQLFRDYIFKNPDSYDHNVDYAMVELTQNNRCSFLNEKNLCKIQAKFGHDYLSNVCGTYPRYANEINGIIEYSANISCPEAARLILTKKEGIKFSQEEYHFPSRNIINTAVNTTEHRGNPMVKYFTELRDFTILLLQNRKLPLWKRILILGYFYKEFQESISKRNDHSLQKLMKSFSEKIERDEWKTEMSAMAANSAMQFEMISEITRKVNHLTKIDSEKYIRFTEEFSKGLGISAQQDLEAEGKEYLRAYEQFYKPFMKNHEYLLENYLVNYVFGSLFPAAESKKPFEAYMMLLIRYVLIKYNLIGISAFRKGLTEGDIVRFIQVFSKAIEHHHTYLESIAGYMKKKKYFTLPYAELLLKSE